MVKAAWVLLEAAVAAGAHEGIIGWLCEPTLEDSNRLMKHPDVSLILATGGPGMVKAAYSSGKPALGVGAGNTPAVIDESADIYMAVSSIILSKTFDNGVICASEQSVIAVDSVYEAVRSRFEAQGCLILSREQKSKLAAVMVKNGHISADIVGQSAAKIAAMAGIRAPDGVKILIAEIDTVGQAEPFSWEKLSPVLALYRAADFAAAVDRAAALIEFAGLGHTASLFTLGCGSWGGNSLSENVGPKHLLNYKTVAERRENTLWMRLPPRIYHKYGCLGTAGKVTGKLQALGLECSIYSEVLPDPTVSGVRRGLERIAGFKPDVIVALGGGSPMDAAKLMWLKYERPEIESEDLGPALHGHSKADSGAVPPGQQGDLGGHTHNLGHGLGGDPLRRHHRRRHGQEVPPRRLRPHAGYLDLRRRACAVHAQGPHRRGWHRRPDPFP